jgi:mono/diheme cytochrome c family protein
MKWPWLFAALLTGFVLPASAQEKVETELYTVVDGHMVDANTLQGFRTWRAAACDRCHGANQEGLVGPALVESLKVLTPEEFKKTVTDGRLEKGMPSFSTSKTVMEHLDQLYAYLKGRADGAIKKAKVEPIR